MKSRPYEITDEAIEFEYGKKINNIIIRMYRAVDRFPLLQISKLKKLIEEYPKIPQFKNYLMVAYQRTRQDSAADKIIWLISEKHPNYFFGKISLSNYYLDIGEYEKIPDVLGSLFDISEIYPEKNIFHISEVANFNFTVARYYLETEGYDCDKFHSYYNNINLIYKKITGYSENKHTKRLDIYVDKIKEAEQGNFKFENISTQNGDNFYASQKTISYTKENKKQGRNELCSCGSGKKYKKCCMKK